MEELKLLVDMVANLPQMAMWVIAAFWIYKVTVIGSVYGLIRLAIIRLGDWLMKPGKKLFVDVETRPLLDGLCISGTKDDLMYQLKRIAGKNTGIGSEYIHRQSVDWLREAIDEKIAREQENK